MAYALDTTPIAKLNLPIDHIVDNGNGTSSLIKVGGRVVSCQRDGTIADRDPGAIGPWESGVISGPVITYTIEGQSYPFLLTKVS